MVNLSTNLGKTLGWFALDSQSVGNCLPICQGTLRNLSALSKDCFHRKYIFQGINKYIL